MSTFISLNRSPCECHTGDERYAINSSRSQMKPARDDQSNQHNICSLPKSKSAHSLGSRSKRQINLATNTDHDNVLEDELLKVVAIKPQLALRPRDNILFEGQMDLRTTFETTYEALAKARLENFREYQNSLVINKNLSKSTQNQDVSSIPDHKVHDLQHNSIQKQISMSDDYINDHHVNYDLVSRNNDVNDDVDDEILLGQNLEQPCNDLVDNQLDKQNEHKTVASRQVIPSSSSYIDPDLSPLIVFDPNMNRLVKVGLKRRSKYRPSTSLRAGATNMFGDYDEQRGQINHQVVVDQSKDTKLEKTKVDNEENLQQRQHRDSERDGTHSRAATVSPNYQQHHLARLTFLDTNIPIDAKRKLWDNANLRDHVREDNLISVSPTPSYSDWYSQSPISDGNLEEGSRDARKSNDSDDNSNVKSHLTYPEDKHLSDVNMHRHGKLERICQNQNIDIFSDNL